MSAAADSDVLIAGAGLVGLALAPALANAGLAVTLLDRLPLAVTEPDPETWDARVYAISPGSAAFLRALGAWQALATDRLAPVESMRVAGDAGGALEFSAWDLGERALAWVVEERALKAALVPLVHAAGVTTIAPCGFARLTFTAGEGRLELDDGRLLAARLVVGADGLRSWVRTAAGIHALAKPYGQTAVVANFSCEQAHHGRAHQWFRPDGDILAWLPLPGRRISIVWSASGPLAAELMGHDPPALAARVAAAGNHALGAFAPLTAPVAFPLQFLRPPAAIAHRLALVGDAAHGVHPLAGQGVNLGFGDAEALAAVLRERGPVRDAGAPLLLERYARRREEPVRAMQTVTDSLAHLFGSAAPWVRAARNHGMTAVDRLPLAKRLLAQSAFR